MKIPTSFRLKSLENLSFVKWIKKVKSSNTFINFFVKSFLSIVVFILAFIPTYLFLIIRYLIQPEGFWQELALLVLACITVGWLQIGIIILSMMLIFIIITEEV